MGWKELLEEYCNSIKDHDTLKFTVFLLKVINLQGLEDFEVVKGENGINLQTVDREIKAVVGRFESSDYYQQLYLLCIDLLGALKLKDYEGEIRCEIEMMNMLSKRLLVEPSFYLTPVIVVAKQLRGVVFKHYGPDTPAETVLVESYLNCVQRPLKLLVSNKTGVAINVSALHIFAAHLLAAYFRYSRLTAAGSLLKVLLKVLHNAQSFENNNNGGSSAPPLLPAAAALFHYFVGRTLLVTAGGNTGAALKEAHRHFLEAHHCRPPPGPALAAKILLYLLPLHYLERGQLPSPRLFIQHRRLLPLAGVFAALHAEDAHTLAALLEGPYKHALLRLRAFALYAALPAAANLHRLRRAARQHGSHIVPLATLQAALQAGPGPQAPQAPADSVEPLLARLIAAGHVRGYISHAKQVAVLSKSNPFPEAG